MLLIARRYLLSAKSHSVVNIIAWISLVSLILPVAAVVILLSIFNGFGGMIGEVERFVEGDLTIRLREGRAFDVTLLDVEAVRGVEAVEALSFVSEQMALINHGGVSSLVTLRGVDESYREVIDIDERVYAGSFTTRAEVRVEDENKNKIDAGADLDSDVYSDLGVNIGEDVFASAPQERVVIGLTLASKLGVRSLAKSDIDIISLSTSKLQSLIGVGRQSSRRGSISGVVSLDPEYDERYAYTSIESVNSLIGRDGVAMRLSLRVDPSSDIERVRMEVERAVGDERFRVETRSELNPTMHQIIRYEKLGVLLISSFVMVLASFALIGALTMLIIEKSGDIATLRAMGMTRAAIHKIFFTEGVLISGVAIAIGVLLGVAVTLIQQHTGFVELPSSTMTPLAYPVELQLLDVVRVVAIALTLTTLISWGVSRRMLGSRDSC